MKPSLLALVALLAPACVLGEEPIVESPVPGDDSPKADDPADPGVPGARRMIGYYAQWDTYDRDYQVADLPGAQLDVINYGFIDIKDGKCVTGDAWADYQKPFPGDPADPAAVRGNFHQLQLLKQKFPHLKVLLSIGGWTWSTNFSALAMTATGRTTFVKSCVDMMAMYGFDGLDIDWEYPGGGGLAPGRPEDTKNYTLLLTEFRAQLGTKTLTIAAPAAPAQIAKLEVAKIGAIVDWINVMSYDFHGSFELRTNIAAPVAAVDGDPTIDGAKLTGLGAISAYIANGVPRDKLVLGMPFYGYGWAGVAATNKGLFQPATAIPMGTWQEGVFDYRDIIANYVPTMTRHWSDSGKAPWLYDAARGLMISYEDPQSLTAKTELVRKKGLGGAMFWELSSDDAQHTLVRTVRDALLK
jgi:chitinase